MDVTQLPFNRLVGLESAAADSGFLVSLPDGPQYTNHLGTVHAVALLAVAEAGAGVFLLNQFGERAGFIPVVRRLEAKYRRPASGRVSARAAVAPEELARWATELNDRGRVSAAVPVEVVDAEGTVVMSATVEWFIARNDPEAKPVVSATRGKADSMQKELVRKFYDLIWNAHDLRAIPSVLHADLSFRGSLGLEKKGHEGFAEYVEMVHQALGDYQCLIQELVEEGDKVFARMTFTGTHRGEFMGHPPTQRRVSWTGCALFSFRGDRIIDIWVLGDLKSLETQLKGVER